MDPSAPDPGSLDRLRDIVLPGSPPWWPPAPGWIAVFILGLLASTVVAVLLIRRYRAGRYRRAALANLRGLEAAWNESGRHQAALLGIPELLRRTAIAGFGREEVVGLTGEIWLRFLDRGAGTRGFSAGAGRLVLGLAYDPGSAEGATEAEIQGLIEAAREFIQRHDPGASTGRAG